MEFQKQEEGEKAANRVLAKEMGEEIPESEKITKHATHISELTENEIGVTKSTGNKSKNEILKPKS